MLMLMLTYTVADAFLLRNKLIFLQLQLCNEENERLNKMLDNLTKVLTETFFCKF